MITKHSIRSRMKNFYSLVSLLLLLVLLLVAVTEPKSIVIDEKAYPIGLTASLKELFQGQRFWSNQVAQIDKKIERLAKKPEELRLDLKEYKHQLWLDKQEQAREYKEHPESRPTQAEIKAGKLRDKADAIETQADYYQDLALIRRQIAELKETRAMAAEEARLHQ